MEKMHTMDFNLFISGLIAEGMISLGVFQNPVTGKFDKNVEHASYIIDTLDMLKGKTSGNLTDEENRNIEQGLYQLRMMYVNEKKKGPGEDVPGPAEDIDKKENN